MFGGRRFARNALVLALVGVASALQVTITPQRGHLNMAGDNLTVTCHADEPITRCQFNFIKDEVNTEGPLIDLSEGSNSEIDTSFLGTQFIGYRYVGSGLDQGQCGIRLHLSGWKRYMLGCRVRGETGGWRYGIMSFTADQSSSIPVTVTPKNVVALPGTDLSILCKAQGRLDWCRMDLPGQGKGHIFLDQGPASKDSTPQHRYHGAGLDKGECGVTLTSLTDEWNGYAFCGVVTTPGHWERTGIPVVVARPPGKPALEVTSEVLYEGGTLKARCTVSGSRPVANVTWYLGDEVVRSDDEDDVPDNLWRWPTTLQRITQKLQRKLRAEDNGRVLKCEANHLALSHPLAATKTLRFTYANACPPLSSDSVSLSCHLAGQVMDCALPQPIGTMANLHCNPGYAFPPGVAYRRIKCLQGGKWNRELFKCHPDCGRRKTNTGAVLVSGGRESKIGEFPWHVAIYKKNNGNEFQQICGGTIISTTVVVSAAHCFSDGGTAVVDQADSYKVAAGKQTRIWEDLDPSVQKRDVSQILVHLRYRGREANFASDIALLRLDTHFDITARVNLVCVDWDSDFENRQLTPGISGIVAGWGFTESGDQSDSLRYVNLPYVPDDTCLDALPKLSLQLLTADKFCAGYANKNTSVCGGDSGGGLVFRDSATDKHYLRGIVSIAFPPPGNVKVCYDELYTAFTKFSHFIAWVQDNI